MGYYINAWLDNGEPQLQVIDTVSKAVCFSWSYHSQKNETGDDKKEIQSLFRELLLLTCKQEMSNHRVFGIKPIIQQEKDPVCQNVTTNI